MSAPRGLLRYILILDCRYTGMAILNFNIRAGKAQGIEAPRPATKNTVRLEGALNPGVIHAACKSMHVQSQVARPVQAVSSPAQPSAWGCCRTAGLRCNRTIADYSKKLKLGYPVLYPPELPEFVPNMTRGWQNIPKFARSRYSLSFQVIGNLVTYRSYWHSGFVAGVQPQHNQHPLIT
jgi:hypothetical protein